MVHNNDPQKPHTYKGTKLKGHCQGSPKGSSFTESKINYYSSKAIFKEKLMERQMPLAGFQERKQDFAGSIVTTLLGRYVPLPPPDIQIYEHPLRVLLLCITQRLRVDASVRARRIKEKFFLMS